MVRNFGVFLILLLISFSSFPVIPMETEGEEIDARIYWYNHGLDRLFDVKETDEYVVGVIQKKHGRFPFKIRKNALKNLTLKSKGLKEVVEELVNWLRVGTDFPDFSISKLRILTGEHFTRAADWVQWYQKNAESLVWSENLNRFIVKI